MITEERKANEIKVFEFNTIEEAESEYFKRRQEGCWQMVSALKVKWSWIKMRNVCTFSMKKVQKAYHIDDNIKDVHKALSYGIEVAKKSFSAIAEYKRQKRERALIENLKNKTQ